MTLAHLLKIDNLLLQLEEGENETVRQHAAGMLDFLSLLKLLSTARMVALLCISILQLFIARARARTRFYLIRSDIVPTRHSAWAWLLLHGSDSAFMVCMAVDRATFGILLRAFAPFFKARHERRGRPSLLGPAGALGLALHHVSSTTPQKALCLIFGVTPSTLSATLTRALSSLALALATLPEARISWPTAAQKAGFSAMVTGKFSMLRNVWSFVDGTLIKVQCFSDEVLQNAYYSGRKKMVCINNTLVWTPDGCVCYATVNFPGHAHDLTVSGALIRLLLSETGLHRQFAMLGDTGFQVPRLARLSALILTPLKKGQVDLTDKNKGRAQLRVHNVIVQARQAAEWGNGTLKGTFRRLLLPMSVNHANRQQLLSICLKLNNFRARVLGENQIATVYRGDFGNGGLKKA